MSSKVPQRCATGGSQKNHIQRLHQTSPEIAEGVERGVRDAGGCNKFGLDIKGGRQEWKNSVARWLHRLPKGIHKGCKKTKQPEHYSINSEEEDDPMDGLTSGIRDLGNDKDDDDDDDENGGGKPLPEKKKKRGRPPSKKTHEKDKSNYIPSGKLT